jgi:proteasome lid subunit RPN8/RPN11
MPRFIAEQMKQSELIRCSRNYSDDVPRPDAEHGCPALRCGIAEDINGQRIEVFNVQPEMKITGPAHWEIMQYLSSREPEAACALFGPTNHDALISHVFPDETGIGTPHSFQIGTDALNTFIKRVKTAQLSCHGVVHSHPKNGPYSPSAGDIVYLRKIFAMPKNAAVVQFFMPIYCSGRLYPYVYTQNQIQRAELVIV